MYQSFFGAVSDTDDVATVCFKIASFILRAYWRPPPPRSFIYKALSNRTRIKPYGKLMVWVHRNVLGTL